jgi:hypothetical protein
MHNFMQGRQKWSLPCLGSMDAVLTSLSYTSPKRVTAPGERTWSSALRERPCEGIFMSSVFGRRSPREASSHEGFLCWAESCFLLLVEEDESLR